MILLLALCLASAPVALVFGYLWASSPSDSNMLPRYRGITLVSAAWLCAFLFLYALGIPSGRYSLVLIFAIPVVLTYRYFIAPSTSNNQEAASRMG